jgi:uncharacterized membrane protein YebE (DUF533 family)
MGRNKWLTNAGIVLGSLAGVGAAAYCAKKTYDAYQLASSAQGAVS